MDITDVSFQLSVPVFFAAEPVSISLPVIISHFALFWVSSIAALPSYRHSELRICGTVDKPLRWIVILWQLRHLKSISAGAAIAPMFALRFHIAGRGYCYYGLKHVA